MDNKTLEELVTPELELLGFECVKVELVGTRRNPIVRLYIDKSDGVTISDCTRVGRALGQLLEREDPFPGRYMLEVSSPGSSRPLTREAHYERFVGEQARVEVRTQDDGKKAYTGTIRSCDNATLTLATDDGEHNIPLTQVLKAHLVGREYEISKKQKDFKKTKDERK